MALLSGPLLFDRDVYAAHAPAVAGRAPAPYVGLNTGDAARLGITDGSTVEVRSQGARLRLQARVGEAFPAGAAFVPEQMAAEGARPARSLGDLVEALACLTFVFLPSGRWFGVDGLFAWLWSRRAR
ncbi:MAG: hypothetical protein K6U88_17000 [Dehalococcoidia bacterium]|nr:hypothetical protein [Dehalococcoidia bacterium]